MTSLKESVMKASFILDNPEAGNDTYFHPEKFEQWADKYIEELRKHMEEYGGSTQNYEPEYGYAIDRMVKFLRGEKDDYASQ